MVYSGEGSVYCVAVYTVTVVTNMKCVYRQNNRQIRNHDDTDSCTASTDKANIVLFSYIQLQCVYHVVPVIMDRFLGVISSFHWKTTLPLFLGISVAFLLCDVKLVQGVLTI